MQETFDLLHPPHVTELAAFRFAYGRLRGAYQPWARVQALDAVAEVLERADVPRTGPAFGVYYDLPHSEEAPDAWTADLGWPIAPGAKVPTRPGLRIRNVPATPVVALRYRGDLTSFPDVLQTLADWCDAQGVEPQGCLLERFHVSDALTGVEERDVYLGLERMEG